MIVYVDAEHISMKDDEGRWNTRQARVMNVKYKLEALSGEPCLVLRYESATPELLDELNPTSILVSGSATEPEHYQPEELAGIYDVFREAARPIMGLCGGLQKMARAYGVEVLPINPNEEGTMKDGGWLDRTNEFGYLPLRVTKSHPLLDGLEGDADVFQAHYLELKSIPDGFQVYAETDITHAQVLIHDSLPLYGTQFHPEIHTDEYDAGRRILANFFRLSGKA